MTSLPRLGGVTLRGIGGNMSEKQEYIVWVEKSVAESKLFEVRMDHDYSTWELWPIIRFARGTKKQWHDWPPQKVKITVEFMGK